jgi:hypothetical protein
MSNTYTYSRRNGIRVHTSIKSTFRYTVAVYVAGLLSTPAAVIAYTVATH